MSGTLVVYATRFGSAREVAEALAEALREVGLQVHVRSARAARDLAPYDLVVLGAPLCGASWHPDLLGFLERHCEALVNRDVAIFALGPRTPSHEGSWARGRAQLDAALRNVAWLSPVSVALFGGIDPQTRKGERHPQPERDAVRTWATSIAEYALPDNGISSAWRALR
jgi:menaquinone-dependent protoporphyrinogen oxidase